MKKLLVGMVLLVTATLGMAQWGAFLSGRRSATAADYAATVLADSPLGYWKLDETSGTSAADSSGNSNNATYRNSPTLNQTPGPVTSGGGAPLFTAASSQYADFPYSTSAPNYNTSDGSAEAWFKTSSSGTERTVFRIDDPASGINRRFLIRVGTDNKLNAMVMKGTNPSITSSGTVNDGAWHYAVLTWHNTGSNLNVELFLDGSSVGTGTTGASMQNTSNTVTGQIGDFFNNPTHQNYFNGYLGQVALYGTALSSTRVTAHWAAR